jgi:hypothetical protein
MIRNDLPVISAELLAVFTAWEAMIREGSKEQLPALDSVIVWSERAGAMPLSMSFTFRPQNNVQTSHKWTRWFLVLTQEESITRFTDQVSLFQAVQPQHGICDTYWYQHGAWRFVMQNRFGLDIRRERVTGRMINHAR